MYTVKIYIFFKVGFTTICQRKGVAVPCLATYMLEKNPNPSEKQEEMFKWVSVAAYTGTYGIISSLGLFTSLRSRSRQ